MDNIKKKNFFLLIRFKKFVFSALNENDEIFFDKELLARNENSEENFKTLEKFLNENIFELEKKFNYYIKDINLIIDYKDFITINVSSSYNFNNTNNQTESYPNNLTNIKDSVLKNMDDYKLIHMIVNKFIIDKKDYSSIPSDINYKNIFLEISFICLKNDIIQNLKFFFSKYEISIKNISCFDYVNSFKKLETENIFILANKLLNGYNSKEVRFIKKPSENMGFFEKLFKLFN